ncbi:MAG TPA: EAL domain-containing protein [Candidatus Competibacteraceae bacterium]|nr:EAL domain-containing protein [Candidatus Competibacteraceae bacterium]
MTHASLADTVISRLRLIEDLRTKLVHVKWSRDVFVLLARVARDVLQTARSHGEYRRVAELAEQLEQQVNDCLMGGQLPQGEGRARLLELLDELQQLLPQAEVGEERRRGERTPPALGPILLLAGEDGRALAQSLELEGFQVRRLDNLTGLRELRAAVSPGAAIIDLDWARLFQARELEELRLQLGPKTPLFLLAERSDLEARLEAVKAGSAGYFTKPVDIAALLTQLAERLLPEPLRGSRVLIVSDQQQLARNMARTLEIRGLLTQILSQPQQLLHSLYRFQPQLLLLDLELKEVDGMQLAQVIRQHELGVRCALLLLATPQQLQRDRELLSGGGFDVLLKPVADEHLQALAMRRLRSQQLQQLQLQQAHERDPVSGLYNRPAFLAQLERALQTSVAGEQEREAGPLGLMLISLEGLRELQESDLRLADRLLAEVASRLRFALGYGYQPAYLADGLFAVMVRNAYQEALLATARSVRRALLEEARTGCAGRLLGKVSIGLSLTSQDCQDAQSLIQHAWQACRMADEDEGIKLYQVAGADQEAEEYHLRRLLEEIGDTVKQQRLNLVFQPVVSLHGDTCERYEMLLRLRNQEGRELQPETVFAIAQHHRVGIVLDRWVIAQAMRLLRERRDSHPNTTLFINVSAAILQDSALLDWLSAGIERTGIDPGCLVFEMPENTAQRRQEAAARFISNLRRLGCGFSLERFGTRDDSLELAQALQVDYVKLDRRLVAELAGDRQRQEQVREITQRLKAQGIMTVAGCVEDSVTLVLLWQCGVPLAQGFFLQRPHEEMNYDFTTRFR